MSPMREVEPRSHERESTGSVAAARSRARPPADADAAVRRASVGAGGPGDLDIRETLIRFTSRSTRSAGPRSRSLADPRRTASRRRVQLAGRAGDDALVLAAGRLLEHDASAPTSPSPSPSPTTPTRSRSPASAPTDLVVETKPDLTPVSEADQSRGAALRARLERERPGEPVLGEEAGGTRRRRGWILDPIDGTRNYTRGIPVWATLIAFADRLAVVSAPAPRPPLVGRARRGGLRERGAHPRLVASRGSRTRRLLRARPAHPRGAPGQPGTCAASATSGRTCSSPRVRPRRRSTPRGSRCGTRRR